MSTWGKSLTGNVVHGLLLSYNNPTWLKAQHTINELY